MYKRKLIMGILPLTEQQLVRYCIDYLNTMGHFVWRNNSGLSHAQYINKEGKRTDRVWRAGIKGGSDIIGIAKDGKFIAIECKIGNNKATALQQMFIDDITKRGGYAAIVYTPEQIEKIL